VIRLPVSVRAEAQLVMAALEDGLRLGSVQVMETDSKRVAHVSRPS
jgi:hypothetical protein